MTHNQRRSTTVPATAISAEAQFERWKSWSPRTWAHRRFLQHHTELNQMYWAHAVPAAAHRYFLTNYSGPWPPTNWSVFQSQSKSELYNDPVVYRRAYDAFLNWTRLSAVMALHSYFETFLRSVATAALESDPGLLIGAPGAADGFVLLRRVTSYSYSDVARKISEGSWPDRLTHFRRLFGVVPPRLEARSAELDALRRMRHNVGHYFGRDLALKDQVRLGDGEMERVKESRLTGWLDAVYEAAQSVEDVLIRHIGAYELLRSFHDLKQSNAVTSESEIKVFKKLVGREYGSSPAKSYVTGLVAYYREAA